MRLLFCLSLGALLASPAHAFDVTTQGLVRTSYVTSQLTSAPFEQKLVRQARDDAALFVASAGTCRGARLEAALTWLRTQGSVRGSDLELAEAILVQ